MGNETLATIAIEGVISAPWAPLNPGCCQIFARECYEHEHGKKYESFRRASAKLTALAFQAGGLAITRDQAGDLQNGDILYKVHGSGGYGHVGIFTMKCGVAENSSTKIGRVRAALGFRTLEQFGNFDLIVRLPDPNAVIDGYKLIASDKHEMATLKIIHGHNYVKARSYADWFKLPIAWQAPKVLLNNIEISDMKLINENGTNWAYVPFVDAAQVNGITYTVDTAKREIRLQPAE